MNRIRITVRVMLTTMLAGCSSKPAPDQSGEPAARILVAATRGLYAPETPAVAHVTARAVVTGPSGQFEATVWSARDGRARILMTTGFAAGIDHDSSWQIGQDPAVVRRLDRDGRRFLRGHELHAHVYFPETRLSDASFVGRSMWDGDSALVLEFQDETLAPLRTAYTLQDTIPLGMQVMTQDPDVFIRFHDWAWRDGTRLFTAAEFRQGDDVFRYEYEEIEFGVLADSVFAPPL